MTPVNSLKHQSQQKSKPVVHKEYIIAFDPLLSAWPSVSCKWFAHQVFLRGPRGCLHKYSIASLDWWWVLPPLGASRQWLSNPEWTQLPLEDQRCLVCRWQGGKETFLSLHLLSEGSQAELLVPHELIYIFMKSFFEATSSPLPY